jgi:hypothetical protein
VADRIVGVRLESVYEENEFSNEYVFAAALQDVWHSQDIESHTGLGEHSSFQRLNLSADWDSADQHTTI